MRNKKWEMGNKKARDLSRLTSHASRLTSSKGFTLMELMVSIAIIGVIAVILAAAMRLGFRSVDSGEKRIESLERMRSSLSIIESQIQSGLPLTVDEDGVKKYLFTGEREVMEFSTNYSIWAGLKGYAIVAYKVESAGNGKKILSVSENIVGMGKGGETTLLKSHDDIYFEYFYKDPTKEEGEWVDEWTETTSLPEKVRLHIVDGKKELATIIPMRARGSQIQLQTGAASANLSKFRPLFEKK